MIDWVNDVDRKDKELMEFLIEKGELTEDDFI